MGQAMHPTHAAKAMLRLAQSLTIRHDGLSTGSWISKMIEMARDSR
jgi:hypothetical protein